MIRNVAIIGMGALGMMYGEKIQNNLGREAVCFVMDTERYQKNIDQVFMVNGRRQDFSRVDASEAGTADLVLVATKQHGLPSALDVMHNLVGKQTVILSLLNGISSEGVIAERYGDKKVLGCVAIGMDAVRDKTSLRYTQLGKLQIGLFYEYQRPSLEAVRHFLDRAGLPYSEEADIRYALWRKFMLNVGINQACMVYETTYGGALQQKEVFSAMSEAMFEVIAIARKEGVGLGEEDYHQVIRILYTLDPNGYPSMRQDALAGRPSEVELFAGTVMRIAAKHQVPVPVNTCFYQTIRAMETAYRQTE